jgi:hypothetical protein
MAVCGDLERGRRKGVRSRVLEGGLGRHPLEPGVAMAPDPRGSTGAALGAQMASRVLYCEKFAV